MEQINQPESGYIIPEDAPRDANGVPIPMQPVILPVKPHWDIRSFDSVIAWLCLPLGFLFTRYVLAYADGFVTTGCFLLLHVLALCYIRKTGCKPRPMHRLLGVMLAAFCFVFSITASPLLHGLCFLFLIMGEFWRIGAVCGEIPFVTRYFAFDLTKTALSEPFAHFGAGTAALSESVKKSESASRVKTILLGLLLTVPLTAIVGSLLASADNGIWEMFAKLGDLLTDHVVSLIVQLLLGIPVGLWLFGGMHAGIQRRETGFTSDADYDDALSVFRIIPNLGIYAGVTPICVLYLLYVISQTNYFLSAFAGRLPSDMIYSEYARRGFFELCAIAVINLLVILAMNGCAKTGGASRPRALTCYVTLLCGFTLFIIATAIAKMVLYISAYGFTRQRLYTTWFMLLLAICFVCLIIRQFAKGFPTAAVLTAAFIVMFGVLCFSRPDALIASYNIMRYEQGTLSDLDVPTLCGLSDDAYTVLAQHTDTLEKAGKYDYYEEAVQARLVMYDKSPDTAWNLSAVLLRSLHG